MKPIRLIQMMILLLSLFEILSFVRAHAQAPAANFNLYLPASSKEGQGTPPPPPPSGNKLPTELVTTWYTGVVPPRDYYNPVTGEWRATNGLGQMYEFRANGDFIYAAFLRIQTGQCVTEVSVYRHGTVTATNRQLTMTPDVAKTRTMIRCGSNSDSTTDGPFDAKTIPYQVAEDAKGLVQLTLTDGGNDTSFYRQGMVESLVGAWHQGAVRSTGFYDPATQTFAPQNGEGAWYRFNADGTYSFGEFGYGVNGNCALTGWIYQEGTLTISGSKLTTTPTSGMARMDNACTNSSEVKSYVEGEKSFTWFYRDRTTEPKLVIIPLDHFQEFIFVAEE